MVSPANSVPNHQRSSTVRSVLKVSDWPDYRSRTLAAQGTRVGEAAVACFGEIRNSATSIGPLIYRRDLAATITKHSAIPVSDEKDVSNLHSPSADYGENGYSVPV